MDNIFKSNPNNMKVNPNVQVTQGHINKLFNGMGPMLDKYHKDNPLMCDYECQKNKKKDKYYKIYLAAQKNLQDAPEEYETAERNFYMLSDGGMSYASFKEKQATKQVKKISSILEDNFVGKVEGIKDKLKNYRSLVISNKHLYELEKSYGFDINQMDGEITRRTNDTNINDRLSVYYNRQILSNKEFLFYIRSLYWFSLVIYICYFIIYRKMFSDKKKLILTTVLLLFPFVFRRIVFWLYPINIELPPPEPVCPRKISSKVTAPTTKLKVSSVTWSPKKEEEETCPTPNLWDAFVNSFPQIGHGPVVAQRAVSNKAKDLTNYVTNIFQ